jgi:hypothetical protein
MLPFGLVLCTIAITIIIALFRSPFSYPYYTYYIDITGKRNVNAEDYVDDYLINNGMDDIDAHYQKVENWKKECQTKIAKSIMPKYREKQYLKALDDEHAYHFIFTRAQTRYKQINYVKTPYTIKNIDKNVYCNYDTLIDRNKQLAAIGYECRLRAYHSKKQRQLMTPELRHKIAVRDNYTCQICGKYMPDGIGLQIDHIIPVAKGGKTIPSNLQVLCSKCNGKKSAK